LPPNFESISKKSKPKNEGDVKQHQGDQAQKTEVTLSHTYVPSPAHSQVFEQERHDDHAK
jgi:hypothetical protein